MVTTRTGAEVRAPLPRLRRPVSSPERARVRAVNGVPANVATPVYLPNDANDLMLEPPFHETNLGLLVIALAFGLSILICHHQTRDEVTSIPAPAWKFRPFGGGLNWMFPE